MNEEFISNFWENEETMKDVLNAIKKEYVDIENDAEAIAAVVDTYYSLFYNGKESKEFVGSSTVTRAEFLTALLKAEIQSHRILP